MENKEKTIDWEQRRYELATRAMVALIDNKRVNNNARLIALTAVEIADELVKSLKKEFV